MSRTDTDIRVHVPQPKLTIKMKETSNNELGGGGLSVTLIYFTESLNSNHFSQFLLLVVTQVNNSLINYFTNIY